MDDHYSELQRRHKRCGQRLQDVNYELEYLASRRRSTGKELKTGLRNLVCLGSLVILLPALVIYFIFGLVIASIVGLAVALSVVLAGACFSSGYSQGLRDGRQSYLDSSARQSEWRRD